MSREIERWITISGQHIPVFKGENVKQRLSTFYRNKQIKHSFSRLKEKYKEYIDEDDDRIIHFPTNFEPEEFSKRYDYDTQRKYQDVTADELDKGPVWFVVYGQGFRRYYYAYENRKVMEEDWRRYGGLSQIVGTGKDKSAYGISSAAGVGEYYYTPDKYATGGKAWHDANDNRVKGVKDKQRLVSKNEAQWHKQWHTKQMRKEGLNIPEQIRKIYKAGDGTYMLDLPKGFSTSYGTNYIQAKTKKQVEYELRNNVSKDYWWR